MASKLDAKLFYTNLNKSLFRKGDKPIGAKNAQMVLDAIKDVEDGQPFTAEKVMTIIKDVKPARSVEALCANITQGLKAGTRTMTVLDLASIQFDDIKD